MTEPHQTPDVFRPAPALPALDQPTGLQPAPPQTGQWAPPHLQEQREQPPSVSYRAPAALNLDTLEREGAKPPFDFLLGGKRYFMSDPQEVDWQDLTAAMSSPTMFFRLVLPAEDRAQFFESRLPSWKMNRLMASYLEHYGLPSGPNAGGLPR